MSDVVRVLEIETHPTLKEAPRFVLAVVHSSNALPASKTVLHTFNSFAEALPHINHEVSVRVKLPNGEWTNVDHTICKPSDLEANSSVDSRSIDKAGVLANIPEVREMLILRAFLSNVSNRLKQTKRRQRLEELLQQKEQYLAPLSQSATIELTKN